MKVCISKDHRGQVHVETDGVGDVNLFSKLIAEGKKQYDKDNKALMSESKKSDKIHQKQVAAEAKVTNTAKDALDEAVSGMKEMQRRAEAESHKLAALLEDLKIQTAKAQSKVDELAGADEEN